MKLHSGQEAFPSQKNMRRGPLFRSFSVLRFLRFSVPLLLRLQRRPHMISSGTAGPAPRRDHKQGQHKPPTPLPTHPKHNLERHNRPHTTSRSQAGGTELPTPCRDARIMPHQGPKTPLSPPAVHYVRPSNPLSPPPHTPTPLAHNRKPHTRDTHPRCTTAPQQPDNAFLHTQHKPPDRPTPPPLPTTQKPHTPALHGRG